MVINRFYERLKINAVFCQVLNNQLDCNFKSVDSIFEYNPQKSNNLERLLRFFNGHHCHEL